MSKGKIFEFLIGSGGGGTKRERSRNREKREAQGT
jgi:hypothetical protein